MITKTLNLDGAYQEIFDEIREKSEGALDINNIEGFFGNILEITRLDKKYLRLPADEPLFEIDANSRKIDIPAEFRSNGLSVQGDNLAETIFFSIDRYFDYMDLSTCDITINWKMGTEVGKTKRFIMSTDIVPGCVVFGWPIDNLITNRSGALTFAVEFNKNIPTSNIPYSFNTLPATISIKDGLILDDSIEAVELDENILGILTNSQFGEGDAAVGPITWLTGNGHGLVLGLGPNGGSLQPYTEKVNLNTTVNNGIPSSIPADLFAQAFVDSGTEIKYMDSIGNTLTPVMVPVAANLVQVEDRSNLDTTKRYKDGNGPMSNYIDPENLAEAEELWWFEPLDENLIYYIQVPESDPIAYRVASSEELNTWNTADQVNLFLKLAKLSVSEAGTYIIKAQGQKFNTEGQRIGAGMTENTDSVIVPAVSAPSEIIIEKSTPPVIEGEDANQYSFDTVASENIVFIDDENAGILTASAVLDNIGALQFVWQKKIGNANNFSNVSEEEVPYITLDHFHTSLDSELSVTEEGEYKVLVKHFLNGDYSQQVSSQVFKASKLAGKIVNAIAQYRLGTNEFTDVSGTVSYDSKNGSLAQRTVTLSIKNVEIDGQIGELAYSWYKQNGFGDNITLDLISENIDLTINSGEGNFVPVVKNNYNGSIYTYVLPVVSVNDTSNDQ